MKRHSLALCFTPGCFTPGRPTAIARRMSGLGQLLKPLYREVKVVSTHVDNDLLNKLREKGGSDVSLG